MSRTCGASVYDLSPCSHPGGSSQRERELREPHKKKCPLYYLVKPHGENKLEKQCRQVFYPASLHALPSTQKQNRSGRHNVVIHTHPSRCQYSSHIKMRGGNILKPSHTSPPFKAPLFIRLSQTTAGIVGHSVTVRSTNTLLSYRYTNQETDKLCGTRRSHPTKHRGSPQAPRPNLQAQQQQGRVALLFTTPTADRQHKTQLQCLAHATLRTNARYWRQEHNKEDSIAPPFDDHADKSFCGGTVNHPCPPPRHNERYGQPRVLTV